MIPMRCTSSGQIQSVTLMLSSLFIVGNIDLLVIRRGYYLKDAFPCYTSTTRRHSHWWKFARGPILILRDCMHLKERLVNTDAVMELLPWKDRLKSLWTVHILIKALGNMSS
ncbi:unnamed protein product [Trifolium pratense]|uniref:Uncharacterized protein n=1 Tax=Trifolium pratense TaxID=57577 RepID=A0ACB0KTG5_TRIPR|nr:unnamed protein product [Trifolium pratense]